MHLYPLRALTLLFICLAVQVTAPQFTTKLFDSKRDKVSLEKMLQANAKMLGYDSVQHKNILREEYGTTLVGRVNNTTVGALQFFRIKSGTKKHGFIHFLVIDKKHRRNGYAKKLLEQTTTMLELEGVSYIYLTVYCKNSAAQSLYKSLGFSFDQQNIPFFDKQAMICNFFKIPDTYRGGLICYKDFSTEPEKKLLQKQKHCCLCFSYVISCALLTAYYGKDFILSFLG